ncbi:MAG: ribosome-associated translation inhibitor RaiA [Ignavibacteriaceae bacterium]|nr:ribosome-associated translation inhibitor RaiA [Ignavibacteriaceae bacterium]
MNISITARKFKAHDTLKEYISGEVASLEKYIDNIHNVDVILSYLNSKENIKTAEIIVQVPGQTLTAIEQTDDFKKSVSASVEKLSRQLQKVKSKKINHKAVEAEDFTQIDLDTDTND